jgi:hypothetical protein
MMWQLLSTRKTDSDSFAFGQFRAPKAIGPVRGLARQSARARNCRNLERPTSTASHA